MEAVKATASPTLTKGDKKKMKRERRVRYLKDNSPYLLMILPAVVVVFLFNYLPIYGVLIAFQDFMPGDKILSDTTIWVGFENFERFFSDPMFWPLMKNTFLICIIGFILPPMPHGFPVRQGRCCGSVFCCSAFIRSKCWRCWRLWSAASHWR